MSVRQRSADMETLYSESPTNDPWMNKKRNIYPTLLRKTVELILENLNPLELRYTQWFDMGCGGGSVLKAVHDIVEENTKTIIVLAGADISPTALISTRESLPNAQLYQLDLERYDHGTHTPSWGNADVIFMVEFLYYLGDVRPWKTSFNEFWKGVRQGTIVVIADGLIPYQYRDYPKTLPDAELLHAFTDTSLKIATETTNNGKNWARYLKVRIYRKI